MLNEFTKLKKEILEKNYSHLNDIQRQVAFTVGGPI